MKKPVSWLIVSVMAVSIFTGSFSAFGAADPSSVTANTNGNEAVSTYQNGIFTAKSSGSGLFALALYKDSQLHKLSLAQSEDELEELKLSMIIPDGTGTSMKIFRFDTDGTPYMVNKVLTPDNSGNIRVYTNESFEDGTYALNTASVNGTSTKITEGRLEFAANKADCPRSAFHVYKHGRHVVYEADYQLGSTELDGSADSWYIRLLNYYYTYVNTNTQKTTTGYQTLLRLRGGNRITVGSGQDAVAHLSADKPTRISVVMDFETRKFKLYVDGRYVNEYSGLISGDTPPADIYDSKDFFIGKISNSSTDINYAVNLFVDNVKIYEAEKITDIGNLKPNVHKTDFPAETIEDDTYIRPTAAALAEAALEAGHPRVLVNRAKIDQINNSDNGYVKAWRTELIKRADNAIGSDAFSYTISNTGSMDDIPQSIARMMDLGLAYMLTGQTKYTDKAWQEAKKLIDYRIEYNLASGGTGYFNDWNSRSYLDVGEVSFILAICYDWMYDAWTPAQKKEISDAVLKNSIDLTYNIYHGNPIADDAIKSDSDKTYTTWYNSKSNWNAVCNGGVFVAAMAFMEADAFKCGTVAEATMRGLEYMMEIYNPGGGWNEGPSYWAYALKYLTAALATMETASGSHYGISHAAGFINTPLYSMSLEGKAGVAGFGDVSGSRVKAPMLFYWSRVFAKPEYTAAAIYGLENFGFTPDAFDLIYFDPNMDTGDYRAPTDYYYPGSETLSFNSANSFVAITGGKGKMSNHDHLDSGSVIVDIRGNRVFNDIGAEHYKADGYFAENRFLYFRARPEGHNIFIINPDKLTDTDGTSAYYGQRTGAESKITDYKPGVLSAAMDLTQAYARDAEASSRRIELDGDKVIITDTITGLINAANSIYWNWYIKYGDEDERHIFTEFGDVTVNDDKASATIVLNGEIYTVRFETDCQYTLAVEENPNYYVDVDPDKGGSKHDNNEYKRLVLKMENTTDKNITVKTIIE